MPKAAKKLTKTVVESITEPGYYLDPELKGFWLRVHRAKDGQLTRTYVVIYKLKNSRKQTSVSIGRHGGPLEDGTVLTAERARNEAAAIIGAIKHHHHPIKERHQHQKVIETERRYKDTLESLTLERVLTAFLDDRRLTAKTAKDYNGHTRRTLNDWLNLPLAEITDRMIKDRHKLISSKHPAQADYTMRILRALFSYAIEEFKDDQGAPLITTNPVKTLRKQWNRVPRRQTSVTRHQLADWFAAVQKLPNAEARDYLMLVMLTGLRHQEAASLRWENVDLVGKTLKVEDTKNHTDHMLPMSDFIHWLLERRREEASDNVFVFPGRVDGHLMSVRDSLARIEAACGVKSTVHDLRRSFITCAEGLDISPYTLKKLLNHKMTADVTSGYLIIDAERLRIAMQRITDTILDHAKVQKPWKTKRRK